MNVCPCPNSSSYNSDFCILLHVTQLTKVTIKKDEKLKKKKEISVWRGPGKKGIMPEERERRVLVEQRARDGLRACWLTG